MIPSYALPGWKRLLLTGLALLVAVPALDAFRHKAEARATQLQQQRMQAEQDLQQFHDDLAAAADTAHALTPEDIERLLAPVNRMRVMAELERRAASAGLSHISYTLSPAEAEGREGLAKSRLSLDADAPSDVDAVAFVRSLRLLMPGLVEVQKLRLSRPGADLSDANLHMQVDLSWLANGEKP